jgi:hypothetical protein
MTATENKSLLLATERVEALVSDQEGSVLSVVFLHPINGNCVQFAVGDRGELKDNVFQAYKLGAIPVGVIRVFDLDEDTIRVDGRTIIPLRFEDDRRIKRLAAIAMDSCLREWAQAYFQAAEDQGIKLKEIFPQ